MRFPAEKPVVSKLRGTSTTRHAWLLVLECVSLDCLKEAVNIHAIHPRTKEFDDAVTKEGATYPGLVSLCHEASFSKWDAFVPPVCCINGAQLSTVSADVLAAVDLVCVWTKRLADIRKGFLIGFEPVDKVIGKMMMDGSQEVQSSVELSGSTLSLQSDDDCQVPLLESEVSPPVASSSSENECLNETLSRSFWYWMGYCRRVFVPRALRHLEEEHLAAQYTDTPARAALESLRFCDIHDSAIPHLPYSKCWEHIMKGFLQSLDEGRQAARTHADGSTWFFYEQLYEKLKEHEPPTAMDTLSGTGMLTVSAVCDEVSRRVTREVRDLISTYYQPTEASAKHADLRHLFTWVLRCQSETFLLLPIIKALLAGKPQAQTGAGHLKALINDRDLANIAVSIHESMQTCEDMSSSQSSSSSSGVLRESKELLVKLLYPHTVFEALHCHIPEEHLKAFRKLNKGTSDLTRVTEDSCPTSLFWYLPSHSEKYLNDYLEFLDKLFQRELNNNKNTQSFKKKTTVERALQMAVALSLQDPHWWKVRDLVLSSLLKRVELGKNNTVSGSVDRKALMKTLQDMRKGELRGQNVDDETRLYHGTLVNMAGGDSYPASPVANPATDDQVFFNKMFPMVSRFY